MFQLQIELEDGEFNSVGTFPGGVEAILGSRVQPKEKFRILNADGVVVWESYKRSA